MKLQISVIVLLWGLCSPQIQALTFSLPTKGDNIVGQLRHVQTLPGDTFSSVGRRFDIGYYEMVEANPGIHPDNIPAGTTLTVPTRFILPSSTRTGIVVNLAELRLYYYPPHQKKIMTFPVGIGSEGWDTPIGKTKIIKKVKDPTWIVPKSILEDREEDGVQLPKSVPPGPDNPMGGYALYLGFSGYRVHGAKHEDIEGIGRRSSHGCIRLLPEDIERLFEEVSVKTPVQILNTPYKIGWFKGKLYLEAHLPLEANLPNYEHDASPVIKLIETTVKQKNTAVNWDLVQTVAKAQHGYPEAIGIEPDSLP
jgi:L,D-transpeptidase ErfK/SrfK